MIFSFSRLSAYETCPRLFYYRYIEQVEEAPTKPLLVGSATHKINEIYINNPSVSMEQAFLQGMDEVNHDKNVTIEELAKLQSISKRYVEYYRNKKAKSANDVIVEHHFQVNIGLVKDIQLQGYVDILERNGRQLVIADWKTGWKKNKDFFSTWQIPLYAWVMSQVTDNMFDTFVGRYIYMRFNYTLEKEITKAEMENARMWAVHLALEIERKLLEKEKLEQTLVSKFAQSVKVKELFPMMESSLCKTCPFATECGMKKSKVTKRSYK